MKKTVVKNIAQVLTLIQMLWRQGDLLPELFYY